MDRRRDGFVDNFVVDTTFETHSERGCREKIMEQIPTVIEKVRIDYILNNMVIRDDIFGILEKHCTVVYYPIENEINCGFHTKRFVKDKLEDFVYINTAKTVAEQVFAAAHELGHVWGCCPGMGTGTALRN